MSDSNEKHSKSQEKKIQKLLDAEKSLREKIEILKDSHQRKINEHKAKISEVLTELESLKYYKEMYEENLKQTGKQKSDFNSKSREMVSLKQQINSLEGKVKEVENKNRKVHRELEIINERYEKEKKA